jgi:hypothetical protein
MSITTWLAVQRDRTKALQARRERVAEIAVQRAKKPGRWPEK